MSRSEIEEYKREHPLCEICATLAEGDPHHIRHKGSGGSDKPENLIRLCAYHHRLIHNIGRLRFCVLFGCEKIAQTLKSTVEEIERTLHSD